MAALALAAGVGVASAAPAPAPSAGAAAPIVPGKTVCTVDDERLVELSGLVADKSGYIVINDSTEFDSRERVFYLDGDCAITERVAVQRQRPARHRGPGALARRQDALDRRHRRQPDEHRAPGNAWRCGSMPVSGSKEPVLHRLAYPDDKAARRRGAADRRRRHADDHHQGVRQGRALRAGGRAARPTTPSRCRCKKVGEVTLPATETPTTRSRRLGRSTVTGAARSPDGTKVVLRTYADAFEWDVAGGDVVAALTERQRRG